MHAGWPSAASLDLRSCTTHPVHIGCRASQITDDSLVPFQLFQLLDFAENALFAPGRNRSSLVLGDGAKSATAVDNDPQAVLATIENIKTNQADGQITVLHSDEEGDLSKVDLLIANILANPLIGLCEHFSGLVKPGGKIALSGILQEQ
ncbi:MAG: hypothetical protein DSY92_04075, partial [Planctomycetota bacterium]